MFSIVLFFQNQACYVQSVISGFLLEVAEKCALMAYYATSSDYLWLTFQDELSVSSSGLKNPKVKMILEP